MSFLFLAMFGEICLVLGPLLLILVGSIGFAYAIECLRSRLRTQRRKQLRRELLTIEPATSLAAYESLFV